MKKVFIVFSLTVFIFAGIMSNTSKMANAALPIIAGQVIKEAAERAMLKVVRKAGYKAASSPAARAEVLSVYSRLSPAGKEAFDAAVAASIKANNMPGWAKMILPAALIGEIGMIASTLTSDSANGIPIEYNEEIPSKEAIVIQEGMPKTTIREGLATAAIGTFSFAYPTGAYQNSYLKESITGKSAAVGIGFATTFLYTKFELTQLTSTQPIQFSVIAHFKRSTDGQMNSLYVSGTADVIARVVEGLTDKLVVISTSVIDGLTADEGAVTGAENATDSEVWIPTEEEPMTFHDTWERSLDNPDYAPEGATVEEPVTEIPEPETKPIEADWWKWLTAPLEKILELLKTLFDWLKSTFGQIPEWFSSILSKLADLLGSLGSILTKLGEWFQTLWDWFADLLGSLGSWFQTLWDWLGNILGSLGEWFLQLWEWLGDILTGILSIPQLIWDLFLDLLVPDVPIGELFIPIKEDLELKFNTPSDFDFLKPAFSEGACPPDLFFKGSKIVDMEIPCSQAWFWKPIMGGLMWFLFGFWAFRKANTLMAKRGGAL